MEGTYLRSASTPSIQSLLQRQVLHTFPAVQDKTFSVIMFTVTCNTLSKSKKKTMPQIVVEELKLDS